MFDNMVGKTLLRIKVDETEEQIEFIASDGTKFVMYHSSD